VLYHRLLVVCIDNSSEFGPWLGLGSWPWPCVKCHANENSTASGIVQRQVIIVYILMLQQKKQNKKHSETFTRCSVVQLGARKHVMPCACTEMHRIAPRYKAANDAPRWIISSWNASNVSRCFAVYAKVTTNAPLHLSPSPSNEAATDQTKHLWPFIQIRLTQTLIFLVVHNFPCLSF